MVLRNEHLSDLALQIVSLNDAAYRDLVVRKAGAEPIRARLAATAAGACTGPALNPLMALGAGPRAVLRRQMSELLSADSPAAGDARLLVPQAETELSLPAAIGDYTDFYASVHHATNVGSMFRPDNPLLPNYKWVPIGYHGRASSIGVSPQAFRRPRFRLRPLMSSEKFCASWCKG